MTLFKGNRKYPNPATVTDDPRTHTLALQQIIEALNVGQRRTRDLQNSFVRLHELVDVGLIEIVNGQLKLTNSGSGGTTSGGSPIVATVTADGAMVYRGASSQTISDATHTVVTFDTEERDDNGYADLGTNNDRLTVPETGWYAIQGTVSFAYNASRVRSIYIRVNGATGERHFQQTLQATSTVNGLNTVLSTAGVLYLTAGDYIQLCAFQDTGGSLELIVSTTTKNPRLSIHRLGITEVTGSGGGGASALADLTDVDLTGLADGDTLVWNSATSKWEPGAGGGGGGLSDLYDQTLNNLADVAFYQPREGDVLTYSSTLGMWVSESPGALSGVTYSEQASNFNALSNHAYLITADNVVATLPASPSDGDFVILTSGGYVANCSVGRNGNNIMGFAADLDLDGAVFTVRLIYMSSTTNWVISL